MVRVELFVHGFRRCPWFSPLRSEPGILLTGPASMPARTAATSRATSASRTSMAALHPDRSTTRRTAPWGPHCRHQLAESVRWSSASRATSATSISAAPRSSAPLAASPHHQDLTLNGGLYAVAAGRAGFAFGSTLIYGKGGYAYYDGEAQAGDDQACCTPTATRAPSRVGPTAVASSRRSAAAGAWRRPNTCASTSICRRAVRERN